MDRPSGLQACETTTTNVCCFGVSGTFFAAAGAGWGVPAPCSLLGRALAFSPVAFPLLACLGPAEGARTPFSTCPGSEAGLLARQGSQGKSPHLGRADGETHCPRWPEGQPLAPGLSKHLWARHHSGTPRLPLGRLRLRQGLRQQTEMPRITRNGSILESSRRALHTAGVRGARSDALWGHSSIWVPAALRCGVPGPERGRCSELRHTFPQARAATGPFPWVRLVPCPLGGKQAPGRHELRSHAAELLALLSHPVPWPMAG